ncbi:MAG TPA: TerC family protein [Steroidobacteraceae bacterium]|nr:TerC family protein [Steroidobacteraceae bacterium]
MALLFEPRAWASFLMLAALEVVLGIDNIIFISLLVGRLPRSQQKGTLSAGLGFAMLTRIALLLTIVWIATLHRPLFAVRGIAVSGRALILFAGGAFLVIKGVLEIRQMLNGRDRRRRAEPLRNLVLIVLQIGIIDIVFSLDSVFTAVGLVNRVEIMVAAIIAAVAAMMWLASTIVEFINRYRSIKVLGLAVLVLIGAGLIGESLHLNLSKTYLYFAMAFAAAVEWLNIAVRKRAGEASRRS